MADDIVTRLQKIKKTLAGSWTNQPIFHDQHCLVTAAAEHIPLEVDDAQAYDGYSTVLHLLILAIYGTDVAETIRDRQALLMNWNDAEGRTHAEVLDAVDRAIRLAKEEA